MHVTARGGFLPLGERPAVSVEEMSNQENKGVNLGISKLLMMENAGSCIARLVSDLSQGRKIRICLFAGTGNNGGDVFVVARHLSYWSDRFEIVLFLIGNEQDIRSSEAYANWCILQGIHAVQKVQIASLDDVGSVKSLLENCDFAIVGMFGTGFKGIPRNLSKKVIQTINSFEKPTKISIDVPSGMEADSGKYRVAVRSNFTVTMHAPKHGLLVDGAKQICGEILIANIGLPK